MALLNDTLRFELTIRNKVFQRLSYIDSLPFENALNDQNLEVKAAKDLLFSSLKLNLIAQHCSK